MRALGFIFLLISTSIALDALYSEDGLCELSDDGSVSTSSKLNVQSLMFTNDSNCIFTTSQNQEVVPVFLGGDTMSHNSKTGVTTFYRTSVKDGMKKGRSEMNFCFIKPSTLAHLNNYQKNYLAKTKQFLDYCVNAVESLSTDTAADYGMELKIVTQDNSKIVDSVIAQWHGRPRRTVYKNTVGDKVSLPDVLPSIEDEDTLRAALEEYDSVEEVGGHFSQGGYPPIAVKINKDHLWVQARRKSHGVVVSLS